MRFGVFLPSAQFTGSSPTQALDSTVAAAVAAEAAGFDDVWVAEHHFQSYGVCPSALTLAAHLLGVTSHISVGTAVTVLTSAHPVAVAEQTLLLDQLSRGRSRLGVGRGGPWIDLQVFGALAGALEAGFAEALAVLLAALAGPAVRGHGPRFVFPDVPVVPPAFTRPHPAVVVAATTDATVDLAARRGLPLLLGMHADDAAKAAALSRYAAVRAAPAGVAGHVGVGVAYVADTDREAEAVLRTHLPRWLGPGLASYRRADGRRHPVRDPHDYAEHLCRIHPVGSPERCRERLRETLRCTGLDHVVLLVEGAGDLSRTVENVHRLGAEVLAPLRASATAESGVGTSGGASPDGSDPARR